ncbi:hypothetical protein MST16_09065 [Acinetobacter sp. YH16040_T]|uniref:antiterminator Q family protein n=1 Tax=unclassified Acinetobacter TaxID=196816 RepID=UPI0015D29F32|nr:MULTISPECIES: antiterminator Q family protein [unclassified Acinetobacter]UUS56278.1 hypothetical protein MST16_09065 [Acinetobacter sp. YH16040_T]
MIMTKERPHFSVAIDWKQRDIEQWLEQYGSWLLTDYRYEDLGANSVMGKLLDMAQGVASNHRRRALPKCKISDREAEAIEDLLKHVTQTETTKAKKWIKVVIAYYVEGMSEETIAEAFNMSRFGVTRDKMHGLIRLVSKQSCLTSRLID